MAKGQLFIVAAPSGTGKTSLVRATLASLDGIEVSISHTTREPRPQEQEGKDYFFISQSTFKTMIDEGAFLEHALVFGEYKGTTKAWVEERLAAGVDVILEIDWQGAEQIKAQFKEVVTVFILPPSRAELVNRMRQRRQDSEESMRRRLGEASQEIAQAINFNYLIINQKFDTALAELRSIVLANRCSQARQGHFLKKILDQF